MKRLIVTMSLLIGALSSFAAEPATSREMSDAISRADKTMFDAFNAHDVDLLMSMFTDDLEFYHDNSGLTNREQTQEGFTKMFANSPDIRRDLVAGSFEVYRVKDFGAIEIGTHRFCHKENGKEDCGEFPFVMIWKKTGDSWKVSRVISYGH